MAHRLTIWITAATAALAATAASAGVLDNVKGRGFLVCGVHLGLPRDTATELVVQTMLGSAKLLRETGEHPTVLRERVTSPGGTTAAAVRQLEDHKVRAAFLGAMEAARDRSRDLAAAAREDKQGTGSR